MICPYRTIVADERDRLALVGPRVRHVRGAHVQRRDVERGAHLLRVDPGRGQGSRAGDLPVGGVQHRQQGRVGLVLRHHRAAVEQRVHVAGPGLGPVGVRLAGRDHHHVQTARLRLPVHRGGDLHGVRALHDHRRAAVAAEHLRQDDHDQEDERADRRGDQERPLAHPLDELAGARPGAGRRRGEARAHAPTTSRKSSARVGCTGVNACTRPARRAESRTAWSSRLGPQVEQEAAAVRADHAHPGQTLSPRPGRRPRPPAAGARSPRRARRRAARRTVPVGHHPSGLDDPDRVAQPLDELELVAGEHDRSADRHPRTQDAGEHVHADRVQAARTARRAPGSSGSCTSAAASWTRCWLPSDSASTRSSRALATPSVVEPAVRGPAGVGGIGAVQPGQVDQVVAHPHLRVEAALLRHVADLRPDRGVDRSRPCQRTAPASAASTPSTIRIAVVLPAPLVPTKPNICPGRTSKVSPSSARVVPNRLVQRVDLQHPTDPH